MTMRPSETSLLSFALVALLSLPGLPAEPILAAEVWEPVEIARRGPLDRVALHADGQTLYAYTDRFLRSDDGGISWIELPPHDFRQQFQSVIHLHPSDPSILAIEGTPPGAAIRRPPSPS